MEVWKRILYEGQPIDYEVSSLGRIKKLGSREVKKLSISGRGYLAIGITVNGVSKRRLVHQLVAEAFLTRPSEKHIVHHKDENKQNNKVTNLEYLTHIRNVNAYHQEVEKRKKEAMQQHVKIVRQLMYRLGLSLNTLERIK